MALKRERSLLVIPDRNPWKEEGSLREKEELGSILVENLELLAKEEKKDILYYDGFLRQKKSNPTINWIDKIYSSDKRKELLMGDDSFLSLRKWKQADELIKKIDSLVVVARVSNKKERQFEKEMILKINPHLVVEFIEENPFKDLSSTLLRKS